MGRLIPGFRHVMRHVCHLIKGLLAGGTRRRESALWCGWIFWWHFHAGYSVILSLRKGSCQCDRWSGVRDMIGAFSVGAILVIVLRVFRRRHGANKGFPLGKHEVRRYRGARFLGEGLQVPGLDLA